MIATILGTISSSLSSFRNISWFSTAYLIGAATSQPLSGHLTDIFGRREGLVLSHVIFATGTLICGLSKSEALFLLGRVVQGFDGGAIGTITSVIECDLVPLRTRGLIEGIGNVFYGVSLSVGGVYGGFVNDRLGWKWAFLIQVPFIAAATCLVFFVIDIPKAKSDLSTLRRIDYSGITTLLTSIVCLQFGLNAGGNTLPWSSPTVITTLIVAAFSFALFLLSELKLAKEPLIPLRLFVNRTVTVTSLGSLLTTASYFSNLFYVPIYLQVIGNSTGMSGLRFIPQAVGVAVGSLAVGFLIRRTGVYYTLNIIVQIVFVTGCVLIAILRSRTPSWCPYLFLGLTGFGFGGQVTTALMAVLSSVPEKNQSTVIAALWSFRSTGMTVGLAISGSAFQKILRSKLWIDLRGQTDEAQLISKIGGDFDNIHGLDESIVRQVTDAYLSALHGAFFISLGLIVLAAISSLLMKANKIPE